jgi:hypothetical protein
MMMHCGLMRFADSLRFVVQQAAKPPKKHSPPKIDETAIIHVESIL